MTHRTVIAPAVEVLTEEMVGAYKVQVFLMTGSPVYRVLVETAPGRWEKIRCSTDTDERRFPMKAARKGTELVKAWKTPQQAAPAQQQGLIF